MSESVANIAVVRALGGIGDVLTAVPALARLRALYPQARITWIGLPKVERVVMRYTGLVDRFVAFPGFPGIPEHPFEARRLHDFLERLRGNARFDLCLQMHGSGSVSNVFAALLGAQRTTGYFIPGLWCPDATDYSEFPNALSEVERWTGLVARLGTRTASAPRFPVHEAERWALSELAPELNQGDYAIVHVGASDPMRRWPTDRFAVVADRLARDGLRIVLTGTPDECAIVKDVAQAMTAPALDLCGLTTLGEAAALIESARLVVTNDTGTSHLAAALGTPSVVVFIASDPARWTPFPSDRHLSIGRGVRDVPAGQQSRRDAPSFPDVDEVLDVIVDPLAVAA